MLLKFRSHVKYIKHNEEYLAIEIFGQKNYLKFKNKTSFNFSLLVHGIQDDQVSKDIQSELEKLQLVKKLAEPKSDPSANPFLESLFKVAGIEPEDHESTLLLMENTRIVFHNLTQLKITEQDFFPINSTADTKNEFGVVISDQGDSEQLHEINKRFLKQKMKWMLFICDNTYLQITPVFNADDYTFCFNCYTNRVKSNDALIKLSHKNVNYIDQNIFDPFYLPLIRLEILKKIMTKNYQADVEVKTWIPQTFNSVVSSFVPYPFCEVCDE